MSSVRLALKNSLQSLKGEDNDAAEPSEVGKSVSLLPRSDPSSLASSSSSSPPPFASFSTNISDQDNSSNKTHHDRTNGQGRDSVRGSSIRVAVRQSVKQHSIDEGYYNIHEEEIIEAMQQKRIRVEMGKEKRRFKRAAFERNVNHFSPPPSSSSGSGSGSPLLLWEQLRRPPSPPPLLPPAPLGTTAAAHPVPHVPIAVGAGAGALSLPCGGVPVMTVPVLAGHFDVLPVEIVGLCLHYLGPRELSHFRGTCRDIWRQVCAHCYRWHVTALCVCQRVTKPTGQGGKRKRNYLLSSGSRGHSGTGTGTGTGASAGAVGVLDEVGMLTAQEHLLRSGIPIRKWTHSHNEVCQVGSVQARRLQKWVLGADWSGVVCVCLCIVSPRLSIPPPRYVTHSHSHAHHYAPPH